MCMLYYIVAIDLGMQRVGFGCFYDIAKSLMNCTIIVIRA